MIKLIICPFMKNSNLFSVMPAILPTGAKPGTSRFKITSFTMLIQKTRDVLRHIQKPKLPIPF